MEFTKDQLDRLGFYEKSQSIKRQELIYQAFRILRNGANTKSDFFGMLAATNLLNAIVKLPDSKGKLSYAFKRYLADVLKDAIIHKKLYLFDSIHYSNDCFYIRCYSLHFSFHHLMVNKAIIAEMISSGLDSGETWDGIRLQQYAESIFDVAKKIKHIANEEDRLRTIHLFKHSLTVH